MLLSWAVKALGMSFGIKIIPPGAGSPLKGAKQVGKIEFDRFPSPNDLPVEYKSSLRSYVRNFCIQPCSSPSLKQQPVWKMQGMG